MNRINNFIKLLYYIISFFIIFYLVIINQITYVLFYILFTVLNSYFIFEKKFIIFNPFTLFSIYFYMVLIGGVHLFFGGFITNLYIKDTTFYTDLDPLLNKTLCYIILCYISSYVGYKTFNKNVNYEISFSKETINVKILNILIWIFSILALINFAWNVFQYAGGNPILYLSNVSIRHLEFENGGTTILYLFGYMAGYLWFYKILKYNKKITLYFLLFIFITIFIKATTGRIFDTMTYSLSYVAIYYFVNFSKENNVNYKYLIGLLLLGVFGLIFYFFRFVSSLDYNNQISGTFLSNLIELINFDNILFNAVDKGNIPNVAILMKVIDSWANDSKFLFGESLFSWIYGFLPSDYRPERYQISFLIKDNWYQHIDGGSLPPTGMGEMFVNFWYFGIFGMYLFGIFVALFNNLLLKFNNYWFLIVFVNVSLGFIMLYPKGEFDNFSVLFFLPILLTYYLLNILSTILKKES